jgi:hypothetical protein
VRKRSRLACLTPYHTAQPALCWKCHVTLLICYFDCCCRLVDELSEKALTFGLLDPPGVHLSECMINMETSQPEAYPDGWWDLVVEVIAVMYYHMLACFGGS